MNFNKQKIISVILTFFLVFNLSGEVLAETLQGGPLGQSRGKYFGKDITQKNKVTTINSQTPKTQKTLRKPKTTNNKPTFEFSMNEKEEIKEKRTVNSKTFKEANGKLKTYVYFDKIHYKDSSGQFQNVDNTLVQQGKEYINKANDFKVTLPSVMTKNNGINLTQGDSSIELIPKEGDFSKSSAAANSILYQDVFNGIDYQYDVENSALKENIILNHYVDKNTFQYEVSTKNVTLQEENGSIRAYRPGEKSPLFLISAPVMIDASGKISFALKIHLVKKFLGKDVIQVEADKKWLSAVDRAYPVTIDPDVSVPTDSIETATVEQTSDNINTLNNGYIYVGNDDGVATENSTNYLGHTKAYIKFPFSIDPSIEVTSAKLVLDRYRVYGRTTRNISLYNIDDSSFDISKVTWNNQPTRRSYYSTATVDGTISPAVFDITSLLNAWINGAAQNNGIELEYENEMLQCEVFAGKGNAFDHNLPYIEIESEIVDPVDPNMPFSAPTVIVAPISEHDDKGKLQVDGVFAHGMEKPGATVSYDMPGATFNGVPFSGTVEAKKGKIYPNSTPFKTYFPNSELVKDKKSNWQSDKAANPEPDKLWQIVATAKYTDENNVEQTSDEGKSEPFQIYKSQTRDTINAVANYYGIPASVVKGDNIVGNELLINGSTIFLRDPKSNAGKTFTPGDLSEEQKQIIDTSMVAMKLHCEYGYEPINLNTGNFIYSSSDVSVQDLDGNFNISRTYNSMEDYHDGKFGVRWDFNFDKYLSGLADGTIILNIGDGSAVYFTKNQDGSYSAPAGVHDKLIKVDLNDGTGYEVVENENITYKFTKGGLLKSIVDLKGNETKMNYDDNDKLTSITSPSGKQFVFNIDNEGRVVSITQPNGGTLLYSYDENGNLTSYTDASGRNIKYEYDKNGLLTSFYDGNGNKVITNNYDSKGRVLTQTDAKGNTISINYANGYNEVTDAKGNKTLYYYDSHYRSSKIVRPDGKTEIKTYDDNDNLVSYTDAKGQLTKYSYDSNGNKLSETRWDGKARSYTYDNKNNLLSYKDFNGEATNINYDSRGNVTGIVYPDSSTVEYGYNDKSQVVYKKDSLNNLTKYEYTGADITKVTLPDGNATNYFYNTMGQVISEQDPMGQVSRFAYAQGMELLNTQLADNSITEYEYDGNGNNISITDGKDYTANLQYDKLNNLLKATDPLGNTASFVYDANGNKIEEHDARGYVKKYEYNSLNKLIKITDEDNGTTIYSNDELGNITSITDGNGSKTEITYNYSVGKAATIKNALGHVIKNEYDNEGNLLKTTLPDGTYKQYSYDGLYRLTKFRDTNGIEETISYGVNNQITKVSDSTGKTYSYEYDGNGNLKSTTDPLGYHTSYIYNGNNLMTASVNEEGKQTNYSYNSIDKLTGLTDPLGHKKTFSYDLNGNMVSAADGNGEKTNYYYDPMDRISAIEDALGNITQYAYDGVGNVIKKTDALGNVTKYEYNGRSLNTKQVDALGNVTQFSYDNNGNNTKIIDANGRSFSFNYDSSNRVTTSMDAAGLQKNTSYDIMDRVLKETDNAGNDLENTYDIYGRIIQQKDIAGRIIKYTYDASGNILSKQDADGNTTKYKYDAKNRIIEVTDPEGKITDFSYNGLDKITSRVEPGNKKYSFQYDDSDNLIKSTDPLSAATSYKYDGDNNIIEEVNAKGNSKKYEYNAVEMLINAIDENGNKTQYIYNADNLLSKKIDAVGNATQYVYDALNRLQTEVDALGFSKQYEYDKIGNLTAQIDAKGNRTSYEYNLHNKLNKITDALGGTTQYKYDLNDSLLSKTDALNAQYSYGYDNIHRLTSITDPYGYIVNLNYDGAGNINKEYDSAGNVTSFTYDKMHRLLSQQNTAGHITAYNYDSLGNIASVKQPNGNITTYEHDILDRITKVVDPEGKTTEVSYDVLGNVQKLVNPGNQTYNYSYDKANNLQSVTDPLGDITKYTYNKNNLVESVINPLGNTTTYSYNELNKIKEVKNPLESSTSYSYDGNGNLSAFKNGNGETTNYTYDVLDRLSNVTNALGNSTNYGYDPVGNLINTSDGNGNKTQYTYGKTSLMTSITNPLGKVESFTYNAIGNLVNNTKPDGTVITNNYDNLNRLTSISYKAPANTDSSTASADDNTEEVDYSYDIMGNRTSMSGPEGDTGYSIDKMGRITDVNAPTGDEVKYEYDKLGRKSKLIYPDGSYVAYSYDDLNRITCAEDSNGNKTTYVYDAASRRIETDLPNGDKVKYTYNAADQVINVQNLNKDGSIASSFDYSYDKSGNIINEVQKGKDGQDIVTRTYSYDFANELKGFTEQENGGTVKTYDYAYDKAGNRIAVNISGGDDAKKTTYIFDSANELIKETDGDKNIKYEYDKNGNRIKKILPGNHVEYYDYDIEGRLAQVTNVNGGIETFGYDGDGNRLYRTIGTTTQTPADGSGNGAANGSGSGSGYDNGNNKDVGNHIGELKKSVQSKLNTFKKDVISAVTGSRLFKALGLSQSNGNGNGNSNGNNGNGNKDNNGNSNKDNNGNSGKSNGTDNGQGKDNGKHLGWYKRAQKPKIHGQSDQNLNDNGIYEVTNYINDVNSTNPQVLMTSDENGSYTSSYTYGLDRIAVNTLGITDEKYTPLYYQYDGRGSVTALVNNADNVEAKYSYDAFGVPKPGVKLDVKENGFINSYGYNGEDTDQYSGLQYLRARYYEPGTGNFITKDSYLGNIMNPITLNRYDYAGNNPVMYNDPSGHRTEGTASGHDTQEGQIYSNIYQYYTVADPNDVNNRIAKTDKRYAKEMNNYDEQDRIQEQDYANSNKKKSILAKIKAALKKTCDGLPYISSSVDNIVNTIEENSTKIIAGTIVTAALAIAIRYPKVVKAAVPVTAGSEKALNEAEDVATKVAGNLYTNGVKALDNIDISNFVIKSKHLDIANNTSTWNKFNVSSVEDANTLVNSILKNAKQNNNLIKSVVDNGAGSAGQQSFKVWIDAGKEIGTKGETALRVVYDELGNIWTVFPDNIPK